LIYAVCSILSAEGEAQAAAFLERRSSWVAQPLTIDAGRPSGAGRLLVPGQDGTDGFFVARLGRP
jgi:16S rRNA (cytosine967-C5)-methyltransferase